MKKILVALLVAVSSLMMISVKAEVELPPITDHEKVTVYLFWSNSCPHCHDFLEYFGENYYKYQDYFVIETYEASKGENYDLLLDAKEYFGQELDGSIPFIVIGSTYYKLGFGTDGTEIIEEALLAYQDESYEDIIKKFIEDNDYETEMKSLKNAVEDTGYKYIGSKEDLQNDGLSDGVIVAIIFGVIILGFGALVVFSRK